MWSFSAGSSSEYNTRYPELETETSASPILLCQKKKQYPLSGRSVILLQDEQAFQLPNCLEKFWMECVTAVKLWLSDGALSHGTAAPWLLLLLLLLLSWTLCRCCFKSAICSPNRGTDTLCVGGAFAHRGARRVAFVSSSSSFQYLQGVNN